jgi:hypothetical protein
MKNPWKRVCVAVFSVLFLQGFLYSQDSDTEKTHELNRDIVLLNLINGLYLTPEQMEALIEKIEAAEQIRNAFLLELEQNKSVFEDVLTDVREVLNRGEAIPQELKKRVHEMKELKYKLEDQRGEKLVRLESDIGDILTENQLLVLDEYKPCTIPPEKGRIGQSAEAAAEGIVRIFERIRHMNHERYDAMKDRIVDIHMEKAERHLGFENQGEKDAYRKKISDVMQKVRNLSDKKFMLQKGDLARQLLPEDSAAPRRRKNQLGKTGRFLLDPALAPILQTRLKG